ncbi:hypothetical protein [Parapedobacter pyrenivorans]|uniref:hypothetical protein n=1 Tax=Parapedobacter pyrenivorans TaxID=1305674 RepID=UPI00166C941C|nr:hypothetical protein [Parapedobacter pyrenivorans]
MPAAGTGVGSWRSLLRFRTGTVPFPEANIGWEKRGKNLVATIGRGWPEVAGNGCLRPDLYHLISIPLYLPYPSFTHSLPFPYPFGKDLVRNW